MKVKESEEKILSIPFLEKIREEANKTIKEEVKGFGWDEKQWKLSIGQVRHIITAYKLLRKEVPK